MTISQETRERLEAWWNGAAFDDRPCILASVEKETLSDERISADDFWNKPSMMASLRHRWACNKVYFGEAVPYLYMDYGANAVALQLGAKATWRDTETIWANPCCEELSEIIMARRQGYWRAIQDEAIRVGLNECRQSSMMLSSYCLGAPLDLIAALYGTENTLVDLLDDSEGVKRAARHITNIIIEHFLELKAKCDAQRVPLNGWHGIWAPDATTPIQEDFSYMIGNDMFQTFCLPNLSDIADAVPYAFYHLDGIGALKHLDSVLSIKAMRAVQWQPGEGHMAMYQWIDVIKHILDSGKSCQVYANAQDVFMLTKEVGAKGMLYIVTDTQDNILKMADSLRLPSYDPKDCSMQ